MDFKLLLNELYTYDPLKIYSAIQIQLSMYCFSQYAEKKILDSFDEDINVEPFESLLELYENYLPSTLSNYLSQLIDNLEEFESLESFCIQCAKTLDVSLETEDELLQNYIANFIDNDVYEFFESVIPENELFYKDDGDINISMVESIFNSLKVQVEEVEVIGEEKKKSTNKSLLNAFNIRKRTLRKKGIHNLTPMKSKTKLFNNKSLKSNRKL
jgi:hypothetical protein